MELEIVMIDEQGLTLPPVDSPMQPVTRMTPVMSYGIPGAVRGVMGVYRKWTMSLGGK